MNKYHIFETVMFSLKLNRLSPEDNTLRLKAILHRDVYPQLRQEPKYGKNVKKLDKFSNDTIDVWRYNLGLFRIFYSLNEETKTIYILTYDIRH